MATRASHWLCQICWIFRFSNPFYLLCVPHLSSAWYALHSPIHIQANILYKQRRHETHTTHTQSRLAQRSACCISDTKIPDSHRTCVLCNFANFVATAALFLSRSIADSYMFFNFFCLYPSVIRDISAVECLWRCRMYWLMLLLLPTSTFCAHIFSVASLFPSFSSESLLVRLTTAFTFLCLFLQWYFESFMNSLRFPGILSFRRGSNVYECLSDA